MPGTTSRILSASPFTLCAIQHGKTLLIGAVIDQSALHGVLRKVRDLGIALLSVVRVKAGQAEASIINATHRSRSRKEEKMKTTNKTTVMKDRKAMLSLLWTFVMFNFIYADILTLYFNNVLQKQAWQLFQSGTVGSFHITQGFVLVGAVLMETAIAMVLLSRVLKYRANRWTNIIIGVLQIAETVWSLTGPVYWNLFYAFFATIEIACMLFIVWYAWTWPQPEGAVLEKVRDASISVVPVSPVTPDQTEG